jgi:alpha-L-arabinofuranosidase
VTTRSKSALILALNVARFSAGAQSSLPVYTDSLLNGFQDWGWATLDYNNISPVHSGTSSIAVTAASWEGLQIWHSDIDSRLYSTLRFWIHGGLSGGQRLQVYGLLHIGTTNNAGSGQAFSLGTLPPGTWQQFDIPLSAIGVANKCNITGFVIQNTTSAALPTFYVDEIQLVAVPPPSVVQVGVDAARCLRTADARWFGVNTAVWDSNFDTPTTITRMKEIGLRILRFPGGSLSDEYHWAANKSWTTNNWEWWTSFGKFAHVATNVGAQAFITVNYGSGTAGEAAAWVRHANITNRFGFKYWEVGNENYGTWEADTNANPHDPYTYAVRAWDYMQQMKAADPTIKVGVVATPGEDVSDNGYRSHPATNKFTGEIHYGWTPVMLSTLKSLGVTPDFLVHHVYPQWTDKKNPVGADNDALLLQSSEKWAADAADLRYQITAYFGSEGTNIELVCTENNSDAGAQGKQSTSLVNGLYYADSLGHLMQTEFNAFVWWDWRNATDTEGWFDSSLYGWRTYGDLGMINGLDTRHPTFYAAKLMQHLFQPGDAILKPASDYSLVAAFAARGTNGALSLLVLNKDVANSFNVQITITNFLPAGPATLRSYGIPQDEATQTNGPALAQDIAANVLAVAGTNFTVSFAPLSMSVLSLSPSPPNLLTSLLAQDPGQVSIQLQGGQPDVRYLVETSTGTGWAPLTNVFGGRSFAVSASDSLRLFRAVWKP